jgi:hypothetical protein
MPKHFNVTVASTDIELRSLLSKIPMSIYRQLLQREGSIAPFETLSLRENNVTVTISQTLYSSEKD